MGAESRLILKAGTRETRMFQIARSRHWSLYDVGNSKADVYLHTWHACDGNVVIRYIEDPLTGLNFITLRGDTAGEVSRDITSLCPTWTYAEALGALQGATARDDRLTTAYAAALTAPPEQDPMLVEAFRAMAADPDQGIRQAVVVATGYCPWPALVEIVRRLRDTDPVEHVRENARLLWDGLALPIDAALGLEDPGNRS
ncbi:hypothetical protein ACQP2T_33835 [Nonomuraea sp. CA-143628]|uniref:hypothetical protein n=1 Tax=Nonomuraea sp. CA-143628 TaxID=3239997 RepID=UPI003D930CC0